MLNFFISSEKSGNFKHPSTNFTYVGTSTNEYHPVKAQPESNSTISRKIICVFVCVKIVQGFKRKTSIKTKF